MKPLSQTRQALVEEFREKLLEKTVFHQKTKDFEIANELSKLPHQLSNDLTNALNDYDESILEIVKNALTPHELESDNPVIEKAIQDAKLKRLNDIKEELQG